MQVISQSGTKSAINRVKQITSGKNRKPKNALKKLEDIVDEGSQLLTPLVSTITSGSSSNDISDPANRVAKTTTTSSATGFIIGRDNERDDIIRMLHETSVCDPSSSNSKCYSVIGIYGIAGSGKTTLAQHVCTYERTQNYSG
jgi:SpoVK/Ycf46/Vps4 family AAA+-type ATPase